MKDIRSIPFTIETLEELILQSKDKEDTIEELYETLQAYIVFLKRLNDIPLTKAH